MKYSEKEIELECNDFERVSKGLVSLKRRKAGDYGNSWRVFGLMGIVYQIGSKFIRIWNLVQSGKDPNNEELRDSFKDISVYAIMAQQMLDDGHTEDAFTSFGVDWKRTVPEHDMAPSDERTSQLKELEENTKQGW